MPRAGRSLLLAVVGWSLAALLAVADLRAYLVDYWDYDASDLSPLVVAGILVRDGRAAHLYDHDARRFNAVSTPEHVDAHASLGTPSAPRPFVMAPAVAVAMRPLAAVDFRLLGRALLVANLVAVLLGLWLLGRHTGFDLRSPWLVAALLGLLYEFEPMRASMELGQTTPLCFLAIVGAIVLDARDRPIPAGLCLAFAALLKLAPGLLVVAWLLRRRWMAAAAFAGGLLAALLIGLAGAGAAATGAYATRVMELSSQSVTAFNNQSLGGFLLRFERPMMPDTFDWRLYHLAPAYQIASYLVLAAGLAAAVWAQRRARPEARTALVWSTLVLTLLVVPSIAWNHYYLYALIPAAFAWQHRARGATIAAAGLLIAGLALMLRVFGLGSALFIHGNLLMSGYFIGLVLIAAALASAAFDGSSRRAEG